MALLTMKKPPGSDLDAVTQQRDTAVAGWRTARARHTQAVQARDRLLASVSGGGSKLEVVRQRQAAAPTETALLEAEAAVEEATAAARAAEAAWHRAYVARHDPEARRLFEQVAGAGLALTEAVQAIEQWAQVHDGEILAANATGDLRGTRPKWQPAIPVWFIADQPGMPTAWAFFVQRTREEFGW